jgi:hypothetical protein
VVGGRSSISVSSTTIGFLDEPGWFKASRNRSSSRYASMRDIPLSYEVEESVVRSLDDGGEDRSLL